MPHEVKSPTYHRLLGALKAVGPYLREDKSDPDRFFFDCLSVCVNDQKAPDKREFWGWWMELSVKDDNYQAVYKTGRYDLEGNWVDEPIKKVSAEEVERTRIVFHEKLVAMLEKDFSIHVKVCEAELEFS